MECSNPAAKDGVLNGSRHSFRGSPKRRNLLEMFCTEFIPFHVHIRSFFFFPSEALLLLNCSSFQFTLIIETPNKNTSFIFDIQNAVEFQFQVYNNHFKVHVCNTALFVCFVQSGLQEKNETAA